MFEIQVCQPRHIALIRFRGQVAEHEWALLQAFAQQRQSGDQYDVIFDLTEIEHSQVTTDFVARKGELPQIFKDRVRIYVVAQHDLKLLVRLYAAYQESKGWRPPLVVDVIDEAFAYLGVRADDFQSVAFPPTGSRPVA